MTASDRAWENVAMCPRPPIRRLVAVSMTLLGLAVTGSLLAAPERALAEDAVLPHERVVELFAELGAGLQAAGADCDKVAAALVAWTGKNAGEMKALAAAVEVADQGLGPDELEALEKKLQPAIEPLIAAAMQCAEHGGTQQAFEALDAAMSP